MASSEHLFFPETRKRRSPGNSYHNADNPAWLHQASLTGLALTHTIVLSSWLARTLLFYLPWPPPFSLIRNFGSASDLPSNLDPNLICSSEVASAYLIGLTPTTRGKEASLGRWPMCFLQGGSAMFEAITPSFLPRCNG